MTNLWRYVTHSRINFAPNAEVVVGLVAKFEQAYPAVCKWHDKVKHELEASK